MLRYCRQIILEAMDHVRGRMRGDNVPVMRSHAAVAAIKKSVENPTAVIDQEAEDLIVALLNFKFAKLPGVDAYTVFSEELGIKTFPEDAFEADADRIKARYR